MVIAGKKMDCEYVDGMCTQHGVKGKLRWKPSGEKIRQVGPDGRVSWKQGRLYWKECDVGTNGKGRTQSRLSFSPMPTMNFKMTPSNSKKKPLSKFPTTSVGQGEQDCT